MTATQPVKAWSSGHRLWLLVEDARLVVHDRTGQPLDPASAEVLVALGGEEPPWTRMVEGLEAAFELVRPSLQSLVDVAERLGRKPATRNADARTTADPLLLRGLAGAGVSAVTANPLCGVEEWRLLVDHRDERIGQRVRSETEWLPPVFADHDDESVRALAARNPATSSAVLARLADRGGTAVLAAVAAHPSTPVDVLVTLTDGPVPQLIGVATNPSTPADVLRQLGRSKEVAVRQAVARHPDPPRSTRRRLIIDRQPAVARTMAQRLDAHPQELIWLERFARRTTGHRWTRWALSQNPAAPPRLLRTIDWIDRNEERRRREAQAAPNPALRSGAVFRGVWIGILALLDLAFVGGALASRNVLGSLVTIGFTVLLLAAWHWWRRRRGQHIFLWWPPRPLELLGHTVLWLVGFATLAQHGSAGAGLIAVALLVTLAFVVPKEPTPPGSHGRRSAPERRPRTPRPWWRGLVAVYAIVQIVRLLTGHVSLGGGSDDQRTSSPSVPPAFRVPSLAADPDDVAAQLVRDSVVWTRAQDDLRTPASANSFSAIRTDVRALADMAEEAQSTLSVLDLRATTPSPFLATLSLDLSRLSRDAGIAGRAPDVASFNDSRTLVLTDITNLERDLRT